MAFFKLAIFVVFLVESLAKWRGNEMKLLKEMPLKVAKYKIAADVYLLHSMNGV